MMRTIAARILAACLLAGLSGCALFFNFGDYERDGGAAGGGSGVGGNGSGSNGSNGSGQSSGSLPSTSTGMCGGQSSSSGVGGSASTRISGPSDDDVLAMDVDTSGNIVIAGTFRGSVNVGGDAYDLK